LNAKLIDQDTATGACVCHDALIGQKRADERGRSKDDLS
jgi:hypothetical protein